MMNSNHRRPLPQATRMTLTALIVVALCAGGDKLRAEESKPGVGSHVKNSLQNVKGNLGKAGANIAGNAAKDTVNNFLGGLFK